MKVALFGGTGFVGNYLVRALLEAGHEPSLLVREGSESKVAEPERCRITTGGIDSEDAIERTLDDCTAVIYNIGLLREFPRKGITFENAHYEGVRRVIEAARKCGARRFLLMSANGVKTPGTPYQDTKYRAEQLLKSSGLDWTVFRPSIIFGDSGGQQEITRQLYTELVRPPVPAVAFPGVVMSPVAIEDVADAFVNVLSSADAVGKTYVLGGPEELTWEEMIRRVAAAAERRKLVLPMPLGIMKFAATLFDWLPFFPATRDQLTMLEEGNTAPPGPLEQLISRPAAAFTPEALAYLRDAPD